MTIPRIATALHGTSGRAPGVRRSGRRPRRRPGRLALCVALGLGLVAPATVVLDPPAAVAAAQDDAEADAAGVVIPDLDDVRGNLTLPTTGALGSELTWESDEPDVIDPTGLVDRPAHGASAIDVDLTVTAENDGATATAVYTATVTPLPADEELTGYFFPHFVGESTAAGESIYFAASNGNDPENWLSLNDGDPVLTSSLGTDGLRDPFIIRSPEGDRFWMLATDLKIYGGGDFGTAQEQGSRSIMIWESDDLVHWSDQREVVLAPENAGNLWAPEAFWDEANQEYLVYWASALYPASTPVADRDISTSYQRMMYATTRDFVTFSEPQVWIDEKQGTGLGMIDSTVAEEDGVYYRFTKDESYYGIREESSTELRRTQGVTSGDGWDLIAERLGFGQPNPWGGTVTGAEGPTVFKSNTDDTWYLLQDQPSYHGGQGYVLFESDDLAGGDWTSVPDADLPSSPRHGTVIPVTTSEYAALIDAYQPDALVIAADPVAITVQVGDAPVLPRRIPTTRSDGSTAPTRVTWDPVDPTDYADVGEFTVEGTFDTPSEVRASAVVTVQTDPVPVGSLTVAPETADLTVGDTLELEATVDPANATARALTWTTTDDLVAAVDADGVVTAIGQGAATVTATTADGSATASVEITVEPVSEPDLPDDAWVDTFDGDTLDPRWNILNEVPANWSLAEHPGALTIHSLVGDTYQGDNTGDNIFMVDVPAGDFTAITHVTAPTTANYQGAGLLAWQDWDNYVRAGLTNVDWAEGGPQVIESGNETGAVYGSTFVGRSGSVGEYLRVQRVGDVVTTSYWDTGADDWAQASRVTVGFDMTQIGLYALAAGGAPSHTATFDYFALVAPEGEDVVPDGPFTFRGTGDLTYLVAGPNGDLALTDRRPEQPLSLVATAVDVAEPVDGVAPVTLAEEDTGRPVVLRSGRPALGAAGAAAAELRISDAGGGKVVVRTLDGEFVTLADGGGLVLGDEADAVRLTIVPITRTEHRIDIDTDAPGIDMSDDLYGVFYEDINYGADGGLYAELVRNRSFEFNTSDNASFTGLTAWTEVRRGGTGTIAVRSERDRWLNDSNRYYLTVTSDGAGVGVSNAGYNSGLAVEEDGAYDFSVWARTATAQPLAVSVESADGTTTYASGEVAVDGSDTWKKYSVTLTADATTDAGRLVVTGGAAGTLQLDMVSLFPQDTWVGPVNGRSVLRKDLAEKVAALKPSFVRFPGGCVTNVGTFDTYLESDGQDRRRTYQWKETIGPVEERPTNWNFWGYNQSYGIGYLEYMEWAEDLGATPLPVVSVGANGCGSTIPEMTDDERIDRWVQDTVDLIEFAKGDVTTEWGAKRAALGHPEPFDLRYIGLGNEENTTTFEANFPRFRDAVAAAWPDVTIISNSGPDDTGARFDTLWQFNRDQGVDMVDEHYYNDPSWFLQNNDRYDGYDREGPHVFLGEYASRGNAWSNALSEASYMTGLERNSDLVELASYAPMFANESYVQWSPDMMWFDNDESWGSVNYYTQKMFMTNRGDTVVPSTHTEDTTETDLSGGVFLSTWSTQVAYDNVTVTSDTTGEELFSDTFDDDSQWSPVAGSWAVTDGEYVQSSSTVNDARSVIVDGYDKDWSDYTLELDARKISGAEGFLIGFAAGGPNTYYWWNLGGWGNTRSVLQRADGGSAGEVMALEGRSLTTGQNYHVKVVVSGPTIELYLDGVLQLTYTQPTEHGLYQVVTKDEETGDLRVKVVNPGPSIARTTVDVAGGTKIADEVDVLEMVGSPTDTNTKSDPTRVVPVGRTWDGASNEFLYDFPAYSITFLTLHPEKVCSVDYIVHGSWPGGFNTQIWITNIGDEPINGWDLGWTFGDKETISNGWSATYGQTGQDVTASSYSWNAAIKPGDRTTIGFIGSTNGGVVSVPSGFSVNGWSCSTG